MPSITFKQMPVSLHRSLKARAALNKRSLNREVIALLQQAVEPGPKIDVERVLADIDRLRSSLKFTTTSEEIDAFKREGRR